MLSGVVFYSEKCGIYTCFGGGVLFIRGIGWVVMLTRLDPWSLLLAC